MKAYRQAADKAMQAKLKRLGAKGERSAYASGGAVKGYAFGGSPSDMGGPSVEGDAPRPSLGKKSFGNIQKAKGKGGKKPDGGKGKIAINIINMKDGAAPGGPPVPPGPPMIPPGAGPLPPPKPPMMAGPGPGGPPMPPGPPMLRKHGGRVKMSGDASPVSKSKKGC